MKLKILILLFSFCFFSQKSSAQKVIEPNKKWIYAIGQDEPVPTINRHDCLTIGEDTIVSNEVYSKLYNLYNCEDNQTQLRGFIRETENSKIYFLEKNREKERLLYDFSLNVGDSIYLDWNNSYLYMDSIVTDENNKKIYYVRFSGQNLKWIEGVGSAIGLLEESVTGGFQIFTCCFMGDELLYHNPDFEECYLDSIIISNKDLKQSHNIKFYPNPATDQITISNPFNIKIKKIKILDFSGRIIQIWEDLEPGKNILKIESVLPGIYLVKMETEFEVKTEKIIVW